MSNICNELRELINRKYRAKKYWKDISGIISASNPDGTVCKWSIHKFHETVEFRGVLLEVMIIVKRVYNQDGGIAYVKDLYAEQWIN